MAPDVSLILWSLTDWRGPHCRMTGGSRGPLNRSGWSIYNDRRDGLALIDLFPRLEWLADTMEGYIDSTPTHTADMTLHSFRGVQTWIIQVCETVNSREEGCPVLCLLESARRARLSSPS